MKNNCSFGGNSNSTQKKLIRELKIAFLILVVSVSNVLASPSGDILSPGVSPSEIQQKKVTGIIKGEDGLPIPGANVVVKGTTTGVLTSTDGSYSINIPSDNAVLVFSFVGYVSQEVSLDGKTEVNIVLVEDIQQLGDVVVTALGIKREKKTLTYSSQQVTGVELLRTKDLNFMNSLSGKTSGIQIKKSSSGAGGSTRTLLRGNKSLAGLTEPLYVVDGIPILNHKGGQPGMWGGTDEGDGLSQINPDDIESLNILKGSNAAVLYGSQGANGVVLITTKKGKVGQATVNFSSSAIFESILIKPELQFDYGSVGGAKESWATTKGDYQKDYVDDFFQTGHNFINSLSISGGNEMTTTYFSFANTSSTGIIPTNKYQKNNVTFQQSTKLFNSKLIVSSNIMLSSEKAENRPGAGYYMNPLTGLYMFPRDRDFADYKKNYQVFNTDRNMYLQNWFVADHMQSNPYWILHKQPKTNQVQRLIANAAVEYNITSKLKFQLRGSYDYAVKSNEEKDYAGSNTVNCSANGRWIYSKFIDQQAYTDGILTYNNKFGDFALTALAGAAYQVSVLGNGVSVNTGTETLLYPNEFYFQNIPTNVQVQSIYDGKIIKEGVFGDVQLGYKEMVFFDFSGRNDWASTLYGTGNGSYFYPSVGLTGILSEMFQMPHYISFSKVRASYSGVGNEVPFNKVNPQNTISSGGGVILNTLKPWVDLKPEMLSSLELGTEWKFLEGRFGFDFTYYNIVSKDQFISVDGPSGYRYTQYYVNAAKITNKGVELTIDAEPVRTSNLSWRTSINFDKNKNKVISVAEDFSTNPIDLGSSEGYISRIVAGGSINDLYGFVFQRNDKGQILLDETTGKPLKSSDDNNLIGNLDPKWSLGWSNTLSYKNFTLSFLITGKFGGKCVSQTESLLDGYGVSKRSGDDRANGGTAINGIKGTTAVTTIDPKLYYTSVGDRNGIIEPYVYNRTNVRLSQLAIGYDFDVKALRLPVKALSLSLIGQNLLFLYNEAPFDPELAISTNLGSQSLDCFDMPSTRTYGLNLKITF